MILTTASCQPGLLDTIVPAPVFIREKAFAEAQRYLGMPYEWGGQDVPRGIDCSGLLVNVYYAATEGTTFEMLFDDATAAMMHERYTEPLDAPSRGDLVFMGDGSVSHVAILDRVEYGFVFFIDAYSAAEGGGKVLARSYPVDSPKLISYGRMLLRRHP